MKNFIIYGAAAIGNLAKDSLEKCGFKVIGYMDKRAYELKTYNELPVWSIEEVPEQYIAGEVIVFVGVKNVFEHEKIARTLLCRGFRYIVYKPYSVLMGYGTKEEEYISNIYDMLFQAVPEVKELEVPPYRNTETSLHDHALLKDLDTEVIAYIPAEFICTNDYPQGGMAKWGNINILGFFTHIDFFRFLDGREDASPQAYLEEYCEYTARLQKKITITDAWRDNVIKNRSQIYGKMNESLNLDFDFFVRNAPEAAWNNDKHFFNLTSGKHRSTFLAARGIKFIPLKIPKKDYVTFCHTEEATKVRELLYAINDDVPIPHPYFYRDVKSNDKGDHALLSWFARYFGRKTFYQYGQVMFQQIKIMDWSDDFGNFARFAMRLGCDIQRYARASELEKQLNLLFYAPISYLTDDRELKAGYDIGVIDGGKVQDFMPYKGLCKTVIIRHCTGEQIEAACNSMNLNIVLKISERYENLELQGTYLLGYKG